MPGADSVDAERYLGELASSVGRPVPSPDSRYQSVTFAHNDEQSTAEVGHEKVVSHIRAAVPAAALTPIPANPRQ